MRAINLVPADSRPGRVNGGKSGGAVYGVFGFLILAILAASVFALAKRDEARAEQELATVEQSTASYTRLASEYSSFEAAAKQANQRINTVRSLAEARFDWAGALRDLSRLIPATANIGGLSASVDSTAGQTSGGSSSQLRGAVMAPAIAMSGCTYDQNTAANLVTQLQAMRRVTNVTLESSKEAKLQTGTDEFEKTGCQAYEFTIVVFFAPGKARAASDAAPSSTPANTPVSTEPAGGVAPTTPGSTTPTPPGN